MANEAATARDKQFVLVCLLPDICFTPKKPGYRIPTRSRTRWTRAITARRMCTFAARRRSCTTRAVDNVKGDEPNEGKGVVSQTHMKISH